MRIEERYLFCHYLRVAEFGGLFECATAGEKVSKIAEKSKQSRD
jgi:hypothetical protein